MTNSTTQSTAQRTPTPQRPEGLGQPDHRITMPDGRVVAVDEHGDPDGPVVTFLHSTPGSRFFDPDPAATVAAGVRLLTIDRAGYGDSSPLAPEVMPSVADRADDVAAVLDALGITETALVGWSNGGYVALGVAARHPGVVRSLALAGTPAPDDEVPWLMDWQRPMLRDMRAEPGSARAILGGSMASLTEDPGELRSNAVVGEADEAVVAGDGGRYERMLAGSMVGGVEGMVCDIVATNVVPLGFDPRSVGAPVHLFYGESDVVVPVPHGDYWDGVLAESTLHLVPDAGHLLVVPAWADILAAVA